jgi:hypothetical protein
MKRYRITILIFLYSMSVSGAQVYRCTNASGNLVYSETPCGPDAEIKVIKNTYISGKNGSSPSAVEQLENYRQNVRYINKITGSENTTTKTNAQEDPCDGVTQFQLRNARIGKDISKCHSKDDVRHIYGEPDSIDTWSERVDFDTRWRYRKANNNRIDVYFKDDRVTKWNIRQKQP